MNQDFWPLSEHWEIQDFPIGNLALSVHHARWAALGLQMATGAWLCESELVDFLKSPHSYLKTRCGAELARKAEVTHGSSSLAERSFLIRYAWDILRANELFMEQMSSFSQSQSGIHPLAVIDGELELGADSVILPGVVIEGRVIIGKNCRIGPNCYIRGHTSIGDGCRIGQAVEIKNSVILSRSMLCHLSYVGDSVIGEGVNLGAGTIVSNFRHDEQVHRSLIAGELISTKRQKLGTIIGNGVHTGIHTSIYPGRKLGAGVMTRPSQQVTTDLRLDAC